MLGRFQVVPVCCDSLDPKIFWAIFDDPFDSEVEIYVMVCPESRYNIVVMDGSRTTLKGHGLMDALLLEGDLEVLVQEACANLKTHWQATSDRDFLLHRVRQRWEEFLYRLEQEMRQPTIVVSSLSCTTNPKQETTSSIVPSTTTNENPSDLPIPLEVLTLTADSGFLSNREIGRLLLLSSRAIQNQVGSSFTWNCLCGSKFPQLLQSPSLQPRQRHGFSSEWIFRQFSKALPLREAPLVPWPPLSPPKLHVEDLIMVMQWYHAKTDARPQNTLEWTMAKGTT